MRRPVVLDTVVLSNFAASDSLDLLDAVLGRPVTVPAVRRELHRGSQEGYQFADRAVAVVGDEIPVVRPPERLAARFRRDVDSGEAGALAVAIDRNGTVATDDRAARKAGREEGVPVSGSIGILAYAVETGELSAGTADQWIGRWVDVAGYYAPVDSIEELL